MEDLSFPSEYKFAKVVVKTKGLTAEEIKYLQDQKMKREEEFASKDIEVVEDEVEKMLTDLIGENRKISIVSVVVPKVAEYRLSVLKKDVS